MKKRLIGLLMGLALVLTMIMPLDIKAAEEEECTLTYSEEIVRASSLSGMMNNKIYPSETKDVFYFITETTYVNSYGYESIGNAVMMYDIPTGEVSLVTNLNGYVRCFYYKSDRLYYIMDQTVCYIELSKGTAIKLFKLPADGFSLVVDGKGRYFVSNGSELYVYNAAGTQVAMGKPETEIRELFDVDDRNGNIYYRGWYNWRYWGYDHDMSCLKIARLNSDNTITFGANDNPITIFYQDYWYYHDCCAEMLGGKYLADLSTFSGDTLYIIDSQIPSPKQVTESSTTINIMDSSVSVSGVNLSRADAVVGAIKTKKSDYGDGNSDIGSVGTRCAFLESGSKNRLFVATDVKTITEYSLDEKKTVGEIPAKYSVYKVMTVGEKLVLIEKDDAGEYYVEAFSVKAPTKLTIQGKTSLDVGTTADYTYSYDADIAPYTTFSSSDSSILSIDENGRASAWSAGTVSIVAKGGGLTAKLTVTVNPVSAARSTGIVNTDGDVTRNQNANNYTTWSSVVNSYLVEVDAKTLMRVQYVGNKNIVIEYYNRQGNKLAGKIIETELELFGGFFAGEDYYFVVSGQNNPSESDSTEVIRVTRYDKEWNRKGATHISGVNTYAPMDAGSLRMAENNGILYIHTCREMYQTEDGYHHQANMTFEIKESDMSIKDSYSGVMNIGEGYVSHSFNQFIKIYKGVVYRVDHGEGYPTGIAFTAYPVTGKMSAPNRYGTLVEFDGYGNYTGAAIGGLEISRSHAIVAYNQGSASSYYSARNVYTATVDLATGAIGRNQITYYDLDGAVSCLNPQLVKISDGHLLMMWMEENSETGTFVCAMVKLDAAGKPVGNVFRRRWALSDCQPILLSDGTVSWYVTDGNSMKLYNIDPFNADGVEDIVFADSNLKIGINEKKNLNATVKPESATNKKLTFSSSNPLVASVDENGNVTGHAKGTTVITAISDDNDLVVKQCTVEVLNTPAQLSITIVQPTMVYTGSALKPAVTVKDSIYLLKEGKDYTLSYKNNVKVGTGTIVITGKGDYIGSVEKNFTITKDKTSEIDVTYRSYVQTYGWQGWVKDGTTSGTAAAAKRMEGIQIKLSKKKYSGGIKYRSYVQTFGWQEWVQNGTTSGTMGLKKRVESLQIKLTGTIATKYDLYYRVYSQGYGWLGWAKNGATAGTAGFAKRIEAIQILPVEKGGKAPAGTKSPYVKK